MPARGASRARPLPNALTGIARRQQRRRARRAGRGRRPLGRLHAGRPPRRRWGDHRVRVSLSRLPARRARGRGRPSEQIAARRRRSRCSRRSGRLARGRVGRGRARARSPSSTARSCAMQYPTLAEALRGTRGVYLSDDRSYTHLGFRGFSRTGDYGNKRARLGRRPADQRQHPLASRSRGFEGRADLDDVERIEVVRGPGSVALRHGRLLRRRQPRHPPAQGPRPRRARRLGRRVRRRPRARRRPAGSATTPASGRASAAPGAWARLHLPRVRATRAAPPPGATASGRHRAGARLVARLHPAVVLHQRKKRLPTGEYETVFNDRRTDFVDTRGSSRRASSRS